MLAFGAMPYGHPSLSDKSGLFKKLADKNYDEYIKSHSSLKQIPKECLDRELLKIVF